MSLLGPDAINSTVLSDGMNLLGPDAINSTEWWHESSGS